MPEWHCRWDAEWRLKIAHITSKLMMGNFRFSTLISRSQIVNMTEISNIQIVNILLFLENIFKIISGKLYRSWYKGVRKKTDKLGPRKATKFPFINMILVLVPPYSTQPTLTKQNLASATPLVQTYGFYTCMHSKERPTRLNKSNTAHWAN